MFGAVSVYLDQIIDELISYRQYHVYSEIVSRYATTTVTGVIANTAGVPLQLTFQTKIPSIALISNFTMLV